jgi:hypothetical protein
MYYTVDQRYHQFYWCGRRTQAHNLLEVMMAFALARSYIHRYLIKKECGEVFGEKRKKKEVKKGKVLAPSLPVATHLTKHHFPSFPSCSQVPRVEPKSP